MKKLLIVLGLLIVIACPAYAEPGFVLKVIDGRTLQLISGETIRLIGVDLPAIDPNDPELSARKQNEAADFIRGLVSGYFVELDYDVKKQDEDGNLLAYVWFEYEGSSDKNKVVVSKDYDAYFVKPDEDTTSLFVFLNSTLIKSGHADLSADSINVKHAELFHDLYAKRGAQSPVAQGQGQDGMQTALK